MHRFFRPVFTLILLLSPAASAWAHYNMLLAQTPSAKRGDAVTLVYQWGHPFEHQLFDAPPPQSLVVVAPDGTRTDLTRKLEPITLPVAGGKKVKMVYVPIYPKSGAGKVFYGQITTPGVTPVWVDLGAARL